MTTVSLNQLCPKCGKWVTNGHISEVFNDEWPTIVTKEVHCISCGAWVNIRRTTIVQYIITG